MGLLLRSEVPLADRNRQVPGLARISARKPLAGGIFPEYPGNPMARSVMRPMPLE